MNIYSCGGWRRRRLNKIYIAFGFLIVVFVIYKLLPSGSGVQVPVNKDELQTPVLYRSHIRKVWPNNTLHVEANVPGAQARNIGVEQHNKGKTTPTVHPANDGIGKHTTVAVKPSNLTTNEEQNLNINKHDVNATVAVKPSNVSTDQVDNSKHVVNGINSTHINSGEHIPMPQVDPTIVKSISGSIDNTTLVKGKVIERSKDRLTSTYNATVITFSSNGKVNEHRNITKNAANAVEIF